MHSLLTWMCLCSGTDTPDEPQQLYTVLEQKEVRVLGMNRDRLVLTTIGLSVSILDICRQVALRLRPRICRSRVGRRRQYCQ